MCRLVAALADRVLVVNSAAIADLAAFIEDKCLSRPFRSKAIGDNVASIFHKRKRKFVLDGIAMQIVHGIVLIAADGDNGDRLRLKPLMEIDENRRVKLCQRDRKSVV